MSQTAADPAADLLYVVIAFVVPGSGDGTHPQPTPPKPLSTRREASGGQS